MPRHTDPHSLPSFIGGRVGRPAASLPVQASLCDEVGTAFGPTEEHFGTKAETLDRIMGRLTKSVIPSFQYFTVAQWNHDKDDLLRNIKIFFGNETMIVRSSAMAEDGATNAMAGEFISIMNVDPNNSGDVETAIDKIIASYSQKLGKAADEDQILIQKQITDVNMSGVIFTYDINHGGPYYVINYDEETGHTDSVTNGYCNRTLYIHRPSWKELSSKRFRKLLEAVREIEQKMDNRWLDIEFCVDNDLTVHLLQIRRITTRPNWKEGIALRLNDAVERLKSGMPEYFAQTDTCLGSRTILGVMPDWNPAEMIGIRPRRLASSLYRRLITDMAWRVARREMGYMEPLGSPLMTILCGLPYIDVRVSFNSFLPAGLAPSIGHKLVDAWLDRLEKFPHSHDKVEFDIAVTAHCFCFDRIMTERYPDILTGPELDTFKESLRSFTATVLETGLEDIDRRLAQVNLLGERRAAVLQGEGPYSINQARSLLEDCTTLGTIPFSILARHAFIAKSFLDSLQQLEILDKKDLDRFMRGIRTVAGEFVLDIGRLDSNALDARTFMQRYGHLRPGTYDITSVRYDQRKISTGGTHGPAPDAPVDEQGLTLSPAQRRRIDDLLQSHRFRTTVDDFLEYMRRAVKAREYAKFVFTRNISDALEIIAAWGERMGLSRDDLSHLDIGTILDGACEMRGRSLEDHLRSMSRQGRLEYEVTTALRLPQIIFRPSDFYIAPLLINQPNFITGKRVEGDVVFVSGSTTDTDAVKGKIVAIEGADPGYDWIFSCPIRGLVTKYGGANSHMAIRCAEFVLPAVIGCGEQIFERVLDTGRVILDCAEERILAMEDGSPTCL